MKIVTLCGSLKFQKEMMTVAEKLALEGYCIITPVYSVSEKIEITKEQLIIIADSSNRREIQVLVSSLKLDYPVYLVE